MTADSNAGVQRQALGVGLVLVSALAFAITPTAARVAFDNGSNTLTVSCLRGLIGGALMAVLILVFRQRFAIDRRALRWSITAGLFSAVMIYGFIGAVATIPVSVMVLIFFLHPLFIAVISHYRGAEKLTAVKLGLACVVLAGLALVLGRAPGRLDPTGVALALIAAVMICGTILCSAKAQTWATSTQVNFYVNATSSAVFAVVTTLLGGWALPVNGVGWLGVLGAGAGVGIGLLAFFASLRHIGLVRATMLSNAEPLASILAAAVVLGERPGALQWVGIVVVIAALTLFETASREPERA